ncbi:uncharacterized protein LOC143235620 [Tachypleus tridentatus]|uniref:uncharacterized protein LOC143235620 n=1 Tax=Tachypleus tridentatus TaxID=6853 RepID=UPI003FD585D6
MDKYLLKLQTENDSDSVVNEPQNYIMKVNLENVKDKEFISRLEFLHENKYFQNESVDPTDFWRIVIPEIYIYSAFWDDRPSNSGTGPLIRIFGKVGLNFQNFDNVRCILQFGGSSSRRILTRPLQGRYRFSAKCYDGGSIEFRCLVPPDQHPIAVSIISNEMAKPMHWIKVHYPKKTNLTNKTVVCTTPMYGDFDGYMQVIEIVAYYTVVGVSHFVFYDAGCSEKVLTILEQLKKAGVSLDVLPFAKHGETDNRKWSERAQVISIQDCMYRHMFQYEYGLYIDLDEFIFPVQHETLQDLLKSEERKFSGDCCGEYLFRHVLYCLDYPSFPVQNVSFQFNTLLKTMKTNNTEGYERSRYITKIAELEHHGCVHRVAHLLPRSRRYLVPDQIGFSHHYRHGVNYDKRIDCGNFANQRNSNATVYDPSLPLKFGNKMIELVKQWGILS